MKKLKQIVSEDNLTISGPSTQSATVERQYTEPIPVDLLIDILSRVPSKSIARFCCVSKLWANLLRQPYFTELFLAKSLNHPRLLFAFKTIYDKLYFFSCPHNTDANSSLVATRYHTHSFRNIDEISSSVHGLVFRKNRREGCTVTPTTCNPATGQLLTLPGLNTFTAFPSIHCGYDPTDKQFKLLCVSFDTKSTQAQVLTLNTGENLWRMIECKPHYPRLFSRGICIDGVLYYLADSHPKRMIVCFDVRSEKFSFIKIDDESNTITASALVNYKGKLGEVHFTDTGKRNIGLWLVEKDHAGKYKCSTNIYELYSSFRHFYIVGMTGTSDIVLAPYYLSDPLYVFYYNVERKALTKVEIQGFQEFQRLGTRLYTFEDYVEDVKLMKCL